MKSFKEQADELCFKILNNKKEIDNTNRQLNIGTYEHHLNIGIIKGKTLIQAGEYFVDELKEMYRYNQEEPIGGMTTREDIQDSIKKLKEAIK